jgi:uncharacterized protein
VTRNTTTSPPGRDDAVQRLTSWFAAGGEDIAAAWLFGSVARDESHRGSDVDVAVLYTVRPAPTLESIPAMLEAELSRVLGARAQVVVLNRAPIDLVHRVLRDGILLSERNASARIAFEVDARNRYWDMLPILREYRHLAEPRP